MFRAHTRGDERIAKPWGERRLSFMVPHADEYEPAAHPAVQLTLIKLSDSEFRLEDRALDIRGLGVFNRNGEQMGSVEDLYIDTEERKVRFLDVGAGGLLGLGEKRFLIPVEAVVKIYDDGVTVDQSRDKVSEPLSLNIKVVPQAAYERDVDDYSG
jgi:sporulation protein YlmC with PRC-barrel domain